MKASRHQRCSRPERVEKQFAAIESVRQAGQQLADFTFVQVHQQALCDDKCRLAGRNLIEPL